MLSIIIKDEDKILRIDKFLCHKFDISFALAQKLIREKKVKINNGKALINQKIQIGDNILILENLKTRIINIKNKPQISLAKQQKFWQNIIYEDENIVAINKPSGLATQGGTSIDIAIDDFVKVKKYQLVHRLDKDTSGLLLIAKNNSSAEFLTNYFKNKKIQKTYIALVYGIVKKTAGTINIPLSKQQIGKNDKVQADFEFGKSAITNYQVVRHYHDYTELELSPITGRTHQLRVHCKEIGHPILNDIKYGKSKVSYSNKFPRLCLHSYQISIEDYFGKKLVIKTPYPNFTLK